MGLALAGGILLGVQAANAGRPSLAGVVVLIFIGLVPLLSRPSRPYLACAAIGCLLGLGAGTLRAGQPAAPYAGTRERTVQATITSDPAMSRLGLYADMRWTDADGTARDAIAFLPRAPAAGRGDQIEAAVEVSGARGEMLGVKALRVTRSAGQVELARRRLRGWLERDLQSAVPGSPGALTLGLLIGDDSALTDDQRNDMRLAGLTHITAVSGWNVTFVIGLIGTLTFALGLRGLVWIALQLLGLAGYVWLVGLGPPVVRAAIMAVVMLAAMRLGRPSHTLTALALTAGVMACLSPGIVWSISFQLSVLATAGVGIAARWTQAWQGWHVWLLAPVATSATVGLLTMPVLALRFGIISLAAIPANLLAAPLVTTATIGGLLVIATSWLPPIADLIGAVTWLACQALLDIAATFARQPLGHWRFEPPSGALIAALHVGIGALAAAATPEGRALRRRLTAWATSEPLSAGVAGLASAAVVIAALFAL